MKHRLKAILIAAGLLLCAPAFAQIKIGVVNLDRLIREAPAAISAQKRLQQEFQPREKELNGLSEKIRVAQENLAKNGLTMSESMRQTRERELVELNRDLQRRQQAFQEDLTQRRNEALSALIEQANRAVRQMAQAEKFDLIFQEAVYWSPSIDLTDRIMKALVDPPAK
ncbi:MAG: OmpH family outer membrane protein [Betaproteobacteria bacterium]|nr:OmpH family outer membrane protein [Betaproteobacteria bacterium]